MSPVETHVDPLQAYVAVRQAGYWAEGFVMLASFRSPQGRTTRAAGGARLGVRRAAGAAMSHV